MKHLLAACSATVVSVLGLFVAAKAGAFPPRSGWLLAFLVGVSAASLAASCMEPRLAAFCAALARSAVATAATVTGLAALRSVNAGNEEIAVDATFAAIAVARGVVGGAIAGACLGALMGVSLGFLIAQVFKAPFFPVLAASVSTCATALASVGGGLFRHFDTRDTFAFAVANNWAPLLLGPAVLFCSVLAALSFLEIRFLKARSDWPRGTLATGMLKRLAVMTWLSLSVLLFLLSAQHPWVSHSTMVLSTSSREGGVDVSYTIRPAGDVPSYPSDWDGAFRMRLVVRFLQAGWLETLAANPNINPATFPGEYDALIDQWYVSGADAQPLSGIRKIRDLPPGAYDAIVVMSYRGSPAALDETHITKHGVVFNVKLSTTLATSRRAEGARTPVASVKSMFSTHYQIGEPLADSPEQRAARDAAFSNIQEINAACEKAYDVYRDGLQWIRFGDLQKASRLITTAEELCPEVSVYKVIHGRLAEELGQYSAAVDLYRAALEGGLSGGNPTWWGEDGESRLRAHIAELISEGSEPPTWFLRLLWFVPESLNYWRLALLGQ